MKIDAAEPFVTAATTHEFADVRSFAGVQACMDEHVGSFGEGLSALRAGMQGARFVDPFWSRLSVVHGVTWTRCGKGGGEWREGGEDGD